MSPTFSKNNLTNGFAACVVLFCQFPVAESASMVGPYRSHDGVSELGKRVALTGSDHWQLSSTFNHVSTVVGGGPLDYVSRVEARSDIAGVSCLRGGPVSVNGPEYNPVYSFPFHSPIGGSVKDNPITPIIDKKRPEQTLVGVVGCRRFNQPVVACGLRWHRCTSTLSQMPGPLPSKPPTDAQVDAQNAQQGGK